jgi:hypothetical protein
MTTLNRDDDIGKGIPCLGIIALAAAATLALALVGWWWV